jgi:hypothetical protein
LPETFPASKFGPAEDLIYVAVQDQNQKKKRRGEEIKKIYTWLEKKKIYM